MDHVEYVEEGERDFRCECTPMGNHLVAFGALGGFVLAGEML